MSALGQLVAGRQLLSDEASGTFWDPAWVEVAAVRLDKILAAKEGSCAASVFKALSAAAAEDKVDGIVGTLLRVLLAHGLPADTVGARHSWTVLHQCLWETWPDTDTVMQLLASATPDIPDSRGNTALHLVVEALVRQRYFSEHGKRSGAHGGGVERETDVLEGTHEHFTWRCEFCLTVFNGLMEAGFDPFKENRAGFSPRDRLLTGVDIIHKQREAQLREVKQTAEKLPRIAETTDRLTKHVSEGYELTLKTLGLMKLRCKTGAGLEGKQTRVDSGEGARLLGLDKHQARGQASGKVTWQWSSVGMMLIIALASFVLLHRFAQVQGGGFLVPLLHEAGYLNNSFVGKMLQYS
eukprot:TRINITY_DN3518_c0_g1_i2.p1 TRINITY_DN3518_c0_g1~~TRINITY_DN3518_c0_g1_i2.p1  ORF type:complete len:353 (-),score=57.53 TRINITY_DN3518_c0_g1_i2:153-1211(-)